MAKKTLFWLVTSILILVTAYVLTTTVIMPVFTKNPMGESVITKTDSKADNKNKKADKPENPSKKTDKQGNSAKKSDKTDKSSKNTESKTSGSSAEEITESASKNDLMRYFELKKTEYLLRSRYNLSSDDSVYLVLDLVNKIARLEMKGIPLHDSNIDKIWVSNSIKDFHSDALLRWLSQPFSLKNVESTIERVQFLVKIAPKDTIEANKAEAIPAPRKTDDVYIVMNFDRNLQLVIQQSELSVGEDKLKIDSLTNSLVKRETEKSLKSLASFKRDAITPKIVITLPKTEAVTIFRALPQRPKLVLKL